MALLEMSSQALDLVQKEALINEGQLKEICADADQLFDQIQENDIDGSLKVILLELTEAIRRAINEYKIGGAEGIKKTVAEAVGRLFVDKDILLPEREKPIIKSFWGYLAKLNLLVSSALYSKALGERAAELLAKILE